MGHNEDRKQKIADYKQAKQEAAVYRMVSQQTGKYYLNSTTDMKGLYNRIEFAKATGSSTALPLVLAHEEKLYGIDNFKIEVLEVLDIKPEMTYDEIKSAIKQLEKLWREQLGTEQEY